MKYLADLERLSGGDNNDKDKDEVISGYLKYVKMSLVFQLVNVRSLINQ